MEIRFARINEIDQLVELSKKFADENCCNCIVADDYNHFFGKKVAVVVNKDVIIGYAYGEMGIEITKRSYSKINDKYFYIDEMYIDKEYRNQGIGKRLYQYLEQYAIDNKCVSIQLNAVSKDYKSLLKFYIEELGFEFLNALLIKHIGR